MDQIQIFLSWYFRNITYFQIIQANRRNSTISFVTPDNPDFISLKIRMDGACQEPHL